MSSDLTVSQASQAIVETNVQRQGLADDFDDFLTLLTVQLQNQDPLSPMDSTEFTNQLVAFAGVEQQINANEKLDQLVAFDLTNASINALSYVGLEANYQSGEAFFDGERPVNITYATDGNSVSTTVQILDETGEIVATIEGPTGTGGQEVVWDGTLNNGSVAAEGTYQIRVDAQDVEGNLLNSQVLVSGVVRGIETQDGIPLLLIGERAVPIGNIINVAVPAPIEAAGSADDGGSDDETGDDTPSDDGGGV